MNSKNTNKELIKLLKKDDVQAFDELYHIYSKKLFGFVYKYVKIKSDAEEIVQEVFVKIWESRKKINLAYSFDSFLFTTAYNHTINILRKRVNEEKYIEHLKSVQEQISSQSVIEEIQYNQLKEQYQQIIRLLTPRQKEVFLLSREKGLSHQEIAEKLQISKNTVENHISKALELIKSKMNNGLLSSVLFVFLYVA